MESDHPSVKRFPLERSGRQLSYFDANSEKFVLVDTCYSTHHLQFADDAGDTLWSSLYAPYETLSVEMQQLLSGLSAVHDMGSFRNGFATQDEPEQALNDAMARLGQAIHPIVKVHPVSKRSYLFVNQSFDSPIKAVRVSILAEESDG